MGTTVFFQGYCKHIKAVPRWGSRKARGLHAMSPGRRRNCRNQAVQSGDVKAAIKSWESILQKKNDKNLEVLKRAFHSWAEGTGGEFRSSQDLNTVGAEPGGNGCGSRGWAGILGEDSGKSDRCYRNSQLYRLEHFMKSMPLPLFSFPREATWLSGKKYHNL